jgi:hypothetical protein
VKLYCKAYHLADLRRFAGWVDTAPDGAEPLPDDAVVYLWDDLTVESNPVVPGERVLRDVVDEDWARFCRTELHFHIPEDLLHERA